MIYRTPKYTKSFQCTADKCRDSCCIGWEIAVDARTLAKYKRMRGALGEDIRKSLSPDGCFLLGENMRCPHLLKNGLCRIICEKGDAALCDICREHPRFYNYYGDLCEWGVGLACESAAQLILSAKAPLDFEEEEKEGEVEDCDEALLSLLFSEREKMLVFALDEKRGLSEKLFILESWAKKLQEFIDNADICKELFVFCAENQDIQSFFTEDRFAKYRKIILSLEPLSRLWTARCENVSLPIHTDENGAIFSRLLAYFIFRYFLSTAMDGDCTAGMGLALFSAAWILAICESEGRTTLEGIAEAAKDFSKEAEYSEDNRDAVLEAFSAFNG